MGDPQSARTSSRFYQAVNGQVTNVTGAAIWMDDGKPWAVFHVEDIVFNVDVQTFIRATGP